MNTYLLDANIFIQAKNLHYGFDFCPAFWEWIDEAHSAGVVYGADDALDILARIEHADGREERAIALFGAADNLRKRFDIPLWAPAHERQVRLLAELREHLGDAAFDAAYLRGTTLDIDDVQELARTLSELEDTALGPARDSIEA